MQNVVIEGALDEQKIVISGISADEDKYYSSTLAKAVTLSSGDILITGGKNSEKKAYRISSNVIGGEDSSTWVPCRNMRFGRAGHAATRVVKGLEEQVMVAGGWDAGGQSQSSVELYSLREDSWRLMPELLHTRADFALQVHFC